MTQIPDSERKTLVLTGASRGIGHATVKRFSSAGWRVITCSRHAFPENCPWEAGPEDHIQVDLADADDTFRAIAEMRERLKAQGSRLSALVNNAAISPKMPGGERMNSIDTTIDDWKTVFHVNFFAPILLARGLLEELSRTKGSVVNVTSIAGSRVHPFAGAAYATSKAALAALTREMAGDFGPAGVRVNAISPGEIETSILSPGTEAIIPDIPLRREHVAVVSALERVVRAVPCAALRFAPSAAALDAVHYFMRKEPMRDSVIPHPDAPDIFDR
jgi:NAD(P)-dependent dehydrogenase (short-subunit alcohol dehydrogenase family)